MISSGSRNSWENRRCEWTIIITSKTSKLLPPPRNENLREGGSPLVAFEEGVKVGLFPIIRGEESGEESATYHIDSDEVEEVQLETLTIYQIVNPT